MDTRKPLSVTTYYGCMHAFARVFAGEMAMVRDLVVRLEGQSPLRAFGWQAALDRALRRGANILERWKALNEVFEERVSADDMERRIYGQSAISPASSAQAARRLSGTLRAVRDHLQEVQVYSSEDVRWVSGAAEDMAQAIGAEARTSSLVEDYLERGTPEARKTRASTSSPNAQEGESLSSYLEVFSQARDEFRAGLDQL